MLLPLPRPDLSDPSKFTNQLKRESKMNMVVRPSIKKHATSIRLVGSEKPTRRRIKSAMDGHRLGGMGSPTEERDCDSAGELGSVEVSVEMESFISTLELVQLQMEGGGEEPLGKIWTPTAVSSWYNFF